MLSSRPPKNTEPRIKRNLPFDRGDVFERPLALRFAGFNPRPGLSTGATTLPRASHAPLQFQSAPRPFDRGDALKDNGLRVIHCFNPRPGLSTGATFSGGLSNPYLEVSIRAPAFRPGRPIGRGVTTVVRLFQSAPRPFDRGDPSAVA